MPFIKKSFISDRLIPGVAIEKLIGQYVSLKKSGANYTCCCPFHHEKTPSFCVTPSKQMYHCFGCKAHGNAIDFVMKFKNVGFVEAVEEVAQFAGIQIEYEEGGKFKSKEEVDKQKEYYDLMDKCATLFTQTLNSEEGRVGLDYFMQKRQLSRDTIIKCRLGFAPKNPKFLQEKLCKEPRHEQMLIDLGVLVRGEYGVHSMFRNRVMIPIFDKRGRIISFGGRTMGDDKPKYMNTKETPIYRKRNELFGLYETLKANNNRPPKIVVCEGYMDVISVRQAGCSYAVASLGTATTPEQINEMFRYTDEVICCYDGDSAGRHAAWHALETVTPILQENKVIRFAFLPPEHDPDSFVREKGLSAFNEFLTKAMSYPEFLIVHKSQSYDLKDPNSLSNFISDTIKLIKAIPLVSLQSVALKLLSKPSGISENQLYDMLKDQRVETKPIYKSQFEKEFDQEVVTEHPGNDIFKTPMRKLMAFIVQQPIVVSRCFHEFKLKEFVSLVERLNIKGVAQLKWLLSLIEQKPDITPAIFKEIARDTEYEKIVLKLQDAPLNLVFNTGTSIQELSLVDRIDVFAQIIGEVLTKPYKDKATILKLSMMKGSKSAARDYETIQKEILQRRR